MDGDPPGEFEMREGSDDWKLDMDADVDDDPACSRSTMLVCIQGTMQRELKKDVPFEGFSNDLMPGRVKVSFLSSSLILRNVCL